MMGGSVGGSVVGSVDGSVAGSVDRWDRGWYVGTVGGC